MGAHEPVSPSGLVFLQGRRLVIRGAPRPGTCTWCAGPVTDARRRTWCSKACVDQFQAGVPERQREALEKRERGVCQACGLDSVRFRRAVVRWCMLVARAIRERAELRRSHRDRLDPLVSVSPHLADLLATRLALRGRPATRRTVGHLLTERRTWWDMDHRTPIADGGHPYAVENLRTLCYWCHKDASASAATRRAEERRVEREPPVPEPTSQLGLFG